MIRLTLGERLSLVFAALLLASSGAAAWLQVRSNTLHEQELAQRLSGDLAQSIADSAELMDENGLRPDALRDYFDRLMTVNPSVEVYLLDAAGRIVGHAAPEGHLRRESVDVAPIERLLSHEPLPILGDDPRSAAGRKVFSAARLRREGRTSGYVYVILMGEAREHLAADVAGSGVLRTTLWSMALVALLGLVAGLVAFRGITRPLRALSDRMHGLDLDRLAEAGAAAEPTPARSERDEIAILEGAFGRMAARIADQWRDLRRQDRERRELVANLSHDLRTPLTSLHGFLETLAVKPDLSDAERRRFLEIALAQSAKVGALAAELFDLARLEHDPTDVAREPFSLADLAQDVAQKLELLAAAKGQRLRAEIPASMPSVVGSVAMIERALVNLLDNAIRHTPEGSEIRIALREANETVEVAVSDNGPGISPEVRAALTRRPSALASERRADGGGLGLTIVQRILELHGSRLELASADGGTVFRFALAIQRVGR